MREQQAKIETSKDSVGMIVINDLVNDVAELHPDRKAQVGARLANMALRKTYHKNEIEPFFPTLKSIEYKNGKALISTTSLGRLICREKSISNFEIIDQGGKIHVVILLLERQVLLYLMLWGKVPRWLLLCGVY